jgi:hypothetical protein
MFQYLCSLSLVHALCVDLLVDEVVSHQQQQRLVFIGLIVGAIPNI